MKRFLISAAAAVLLSGLVSANDWLHIYHNGGKINTGKLSDLSGVTFTPTSKSDTLFQSMNVDRNGENMFTVDIANVDSCVLGTNVPTIFINIENNAEVVQKDVYLNAKIRMEGYEMFDDFAETDVTIKGRGNSTWNMEKKPYRLKFAKKQTLCGLAKAKNYCLIANFIDCTMMRNTIALKLGQMLGMPYTNHSIPVNVVINGTYRGAYMLTEKIGINGASVDVDETEGILFEMDSNYDEPYKFHSSKFYLPVMVKDPDFVELYEADPNFGTPASNLEKWKAQFHAMEGTLSTSGAPSDEFENQMDIESLVKYMLVYNFTGNQEPGHPKSVYMYKANTDDKFHMGPLWDFDWAYTFTQAGDGLQSPETYLLTGSEAGARFFQACCRSPKFKELYAAQWAEFKEKIYPELLKYIDEYAKIIEVSAYQNGVKWPAGYYSGKYTLKSTADYEANLRELKSWLQRRMAFMDTANNWGLYY